MTSGFGIRGFGGVVALCALLGVAHAAPPEAGQGGRGRGTHGGAQMFGGGAYDNGQLQDDWFYDSYRDQKGFGADYYLQDNVYGTYDSKADDNDWFFDEYAIVEGANPPALPTPPRPGGGGRVPEPTPTPTMMRLDGTVEAIKQVSVADTEYQHDVVLLSRGADRWIVDLGPSDALGDLAIAVGDPLTVDGHIGRVGGRAVVFADRLDPIGENRVIEQDLKLEASPIPLTPGRDEGYTGEILRLKDVNVEGGRNSHAVALILTEDGRQVPVDLGPSADFASYALKEGDTLDVSGRTVLVGEYLVIWANQLLVDGQPVDLRGRGPRGGRGGP